MIDAIEQVSRQRHPQGTVLRFNQSKGLGCLEGVFTIDEQVPVGASRRWSDCCSP